jgi:ketol-acid reductoisomerase
MSELNKKELLDILDCFKNVYCEVCKDMPPIKFNFTSKEELTEDAQRAYQQIKKMIQKLHKKRGLTGMAGEIFNEAHKNQLEVTEEWIEEKAWKLRDLIAYIIKPSQEVSQEEGENKLINFIRSLVRESSITVDPHRNRGK